MSLSLNTHLISISFNIQDEDWILNDPDDLENGWSRNTLHYASLDAIRRYFIEAFTYGGNQYIHDIDYAMRQKLWGTTLISMNAKNAAFLHKEQLDFIEKVISMEYNEPYHLSPHVYLVKSILVIHN